MNKFNVIYLVVIVFQDIVATDECTFWLENGSPKKPLFLHKSPDLKIIYPGEDGAIRMSKGDTLRLSCLDKKFKYYNTKDLAVTCVKDDIVEVRKEKIQFVELECDAYPTSIIRKMYTTCSGNGRVYEIGFNIRGEFRPIVIVCYIDREAKTVYAYFNHTYPNMSDAISNYLPGISFQDDNLYDFNIAETYTLNYQRKEFEILLESKVQAVRYIRGDNKHLLISAPLIPASHLVYGYEKSAVFHYLNTAPQWGIIRNGNWKKVESKVRARLMAGGKELTTMSGTFGVATLPDSQNIERDLFLCRDEKNQRFHPVPKFFWKLIYDRKQKKGEVIIVVNNPYLKEMPSSYYLCKNICSEMKWFGMKRNTISKGYVYCCEMEDFLKATGIENVFEERVTSRETSTIPSSTLDDCDDIIWCLH